MTSWHTLSAFPLCAVAAIGFPPRPAPEAAPVLALLWYIAVELYFELLKSSLII